MTEPAGADTMGRPGAVASDPSDEELRVSARVIVHLSRQPRLGGSDHGIESLTQEGMAGALGTTPASVSHAVGRLQSGGLLVARRAHVPGRSRRVRVYELTPEGEEIARRIVERMARHASPTDGLGTVSGIGPRPPGPPAD
jgi:DNA-binding MarR family transcriptional regulator